LQTLRNFLVGRGIRLGAPERLVLPLADGSGDRLAAALNRPEPRAPTRPLLVLVHGLTGGEDSTNIRASAAYLLGLGYPVLRLNLRGAGQSRPLCRFRYHAGRSGDFAAALAALPPLLTAAGVVAIGVSLGGSMLLKYLGERGAETPLRAAVAVSAPLDLSAAARTIMRPRNRPYHAYLLGSLKREAVAPGAELRAEERQAIRSARSIWEFDERFVAPANGFAGAEDYYARTSSRQSLDRVGVPTLVVYAQDDPWIPPASYLAHDWRRNPRVIPVLPRRGGHVGFHGADDRRIPWHDRCIGRFLAAIGA
jgi:predicted alpha/beta-fold hydrolase